MTDENTLSLFLTFISLFEKNKTFYAQRRLTSLNLNIQSSSIIIVMEGNKNIMMNVDNDENLFDSSDIVDIVDDVVAEEEEEERDKKEQQQDEDEQEARKRKSDIDLDSNIDKSALKPGVLVIAKDCGNNDTRYNSAVSVKVGYTALIQEPGLVDDGMCTTCELSCTVLIVY